MIKRIVFVIVILVVLTGILAGIKSLQIKRMISMGQHVTQPPEIVTVVSVQPAVWETVLTSVGSLGSVQGVVVSAELSGRISKIPFESGSIVQSGALLVQLDIESDQAQLRGAEATAALAKLTFERNTKLLDQNMISRSDCDNAEAQFKQSVAQVDYLRAVIEKKTIRAPFSGRLGIRQVNLGQFLHEGDPIVSLQSLDPIYANFLLPQQQLAQIHTDFPVQITTDAIPGQSIEGKITAINAEVDTATRNIQVQATRPNSKKMLRPGMYVNVSVKLPVKADVLIIPATAVLYAPYSDSVFIVEAKKNKTEEQNDSVVRQQFVKLGEKRGDFIAVLSGLNKDDQIVSTGVFKLRNGQAVRINNTLSPEFKLAPTPENT